MALDILDDILLLLIVYQRRERVDALGLMVTVTLEAGELGRVVVVSGTLDFEGRDLAALFQLLQEAHQHTIWLEFAVEHFARQGDTGDLGGL